MHDACTSGTSRVLIVASLQRLKMETLVPALADCKVRSVIKFLKKKGRGMLSAGVLLLHDSARPHTTPWSTHLLHELSPDLEPSDFHLFLHFNKVLSGQRQRFQNDRGAEMCVT